MKSFVYTIALTGMLLSCSPLLMEQMEPEYRPDGEVGLMTKSGENPAPPDQSAVAHFFQTNHKIILMRHVEFRDSVYVQTLTQEDMAALKITESEQEFGNQYVIALNESIKQQ